MNTGLSSVKVISDHGKDGLGRVQASVEGSVAHMPFTDLVATDISLLSVLSI